MEIERQIEPEEPEIALLKEWLSKASRECRAYIKGAVKALLYMQENQCASQGHDKPSVGKQSEL